MTEYRIADLAREAGTTVRNVRVYQDRGLIPPPERRGRVGYYSEEHLERLRMIGRLLARGYTFATIGELFAAWRRGWRLEDVLGLEEAVGAPWGDEAPEEVTLGDLKAMFGRQFTRAAVDRACVLGILVPGEPGRFSVPSPGLFAVGRELAAAGVGVPEILDAAEAMFAGMDAIAKGFVDLAVRQIVQRPCPEGEPEPRRVAEATEVVRRLRPMARQAVQAAFAASMRQETARGVETVAGYLSGGR